MALKGKPFTEEHKRKIGEANKGKKRTKEHYLKVVATRIKNSSYIAWNKGLKNVYSKETKEKMSKAKKGIRLSINQRKKLSKMAKEKGRGKWMRGRMGKLSNNWKGGVNSENIKIRHRIEFRLWREAVFARDNWTCQKCKKRDGGELHPHHIFNFATHLNLRFAIDNGITFCKKCHMEFHKTYGKINNTKKQLNEFIETNVCK